MSVLYCFEVDVDITMVQFLSYKVDCYVDGSDAHVPAGDITDDEDGAVHIQYYGLYADNAGTRGNGSATVIGLSCRRLDLGAGVTEEGISRVKLGNSHTH